MEAGNLKKSNLEKLIEGKQRYDHKYIWKTFVEEYPAVLVVNLIEHGKLINKRNTENYLVRVISNEPPEGELYTNNKIPVNGDEVVDTHYAFQILWPDTYYQKAIESVPEKLIDSSLGKGHYKFLQYLNEKYIESNMISIMKKGKGLHYLAHSANIANHLKKKKAPKITIDLVLVHNFIKDMTAYRNIQEYNYEKLLEYKEIKKLFSDEYANMLFKFLKTITRKPKEKPENHITRIIADCEKFSKSDDFYVPPLVQLLNYLYETKHLKTPRLSMKIEKLNNNYILLEGVNKLIDNYKIKNEAILDLRKELLEASFNRIEKLISTYLKYKRDGKIGLKIFKRKKKEVMEIYNSFSDIWKKLFPDEEIPFIHYYIRDQKKKSMS